MRRNVVRTWIVACVGAGLLAGGPVLADKPSWAGEGKKQEKQHEGKHKNKHKNKKHQGHDEGDRNAARERQGSSARGREHFADQHRVVVRDYYDEQFRAGRCPPGLAKKNNGCMPPGQAKKWRVGRPLPPNVVYYEVPPALVVKLGPPPTGHRYVRVAADILLIAVGTGLIVDAIQDLSRL